MGHDETLVEAVTDLHADLGTRPWPALVSETAAVHGLNPTLLDRKFREAYGDPEELQTRLLASKERAARLLQRARGARHRLERRGAIFAYDPTFIGQPVVRNGEEMILVGIASANTFYTMRQDGRLLRISSGSEVAVIVRQVHGRTHAGPPVVIFGEQLERVLL